MSSRGRIATMLVALAACPCAALGSVIVSLNNPGSTTLHEIEVEPGETFALNLRLDNEVPVSAVQLKLQASSSNVLDVVQVAGIVPWSFADSLLIGGLNPQSAQTKTVSEDPHFGPGSAAIGTIQVTINPFADTLGAYPLEIADAQYFHISVFPENDWMPAAVGPSLIVHVVPEPTSICIMIVSVLVPCRRWL